MELSRDDMATLIERIAQNVAVMTARGAYLTRKQVAMKLGYTYSGVASLLESPDFPAPVRFSPGANPRWKCGDIQDWADKQRAIAQMRPAH